MENSQTIETLAEEVILLSRNILVMNLRFLDSAFNKLPAMQYNKNSITTHGICLYYTQNNFSLSIRTKNFLLIIHITCTAQFTIHLQHIYMIKPYGTLMAILLWSMLL